MESLLILLFIRNRKRNFFPNGQKFKVNDYIKTAGRKFRMKLTCISTSPENSETRGQNAFQNPSIQSPTALYTGSAQPQLPNKHMTEK